MDKERTVMAELKKVIKVFGHDTIVTDVPIANVLIENFNEYELEDGSVLRVKTCQIQF